MILPVDAATDAYFEQLIHVIRGEINVAISAMQRASAGGALRLGQSQRWESFKHEPSACKHRLRDLLQVGEYGAQI